MSRDLSGSRHDPVGARPSRYRAILFSASGQIAALINLTAVDDTEASSLAEAMVDGHAVELWDGLRFVEHFPAIKAESHAKAEP